MPLFEYRCQDCQHGFELLVRESTSFECPSCHGDKL
jgi:putative FmdB family regulatory protein